MLEMRPLAGRSGFVSPDRAMAFRAPHDRSAIHTQSMSDFDCLPDAPDLDLAFVAMPRHVGDRACRGFFIILGSCRTAAPRASGSLCRWWSSPRRRPGLAGARGLSRRSRSPARCRHPPRERFDDHFPSVERDADVGARQQPGTSPARRRYGHATFRCDRHALLYLCVATLRSRFRRKGRQAKGPGMSAPQNPSLAAPEGACQ
jgi:hypothetical protein